MELLFDWITGSGAVESSTALLLIGMSALTSLITATLGIGGGVFLIAVMASTMPVSALIPVHGLVQLGSNGNRALMTYKYCDWSMVKFFCIGALLGAVLASFIVVQLPLVVIQYAVAGFILFLVWGQKPKATESSALGRSIAGFFTTLVSMFVGATGPLVAAFVHRNNSSKMQITATFATCMTFQHGLKAFVFTAVGFSFVQWAGLIVAMIASGALGTYIGLKVLKKISSATFSVLFKWVVTLLALRLLWQAVSASL